MAVPTMLANHCTRVLIDWSSTRSRLKLVPALALERRVPAR
jgi:hypothetical protein